MVAAIIPVAVFLLYRGDPWALLGGVGALAGHGTTGHASYLLGEYRTDGCWYFFPVTLAVKTPLAFLVLVAFGARRAWIPVACAAAVLAVVLPSHINLGSRHILVIYCFLSMAAGVGLAGLFRHLDWWCCRRRWPARAAGVALAAWALASSAATSAWASLPTVPTETPLPPSLTWPTGKLGNGNRRIESRTPSAATAAKTYE